MVVGGYFLDFILRGELWDFCCLLVSFFLFRFFGGVAYFGFVLLFYVSFGF